VKILPGNEAMDSLRLPQLLADTRLVHPQNGPGKREERRLQRHKTDCFSPRIGNGGAA